MGGRREGERSSRSLGVIEETGLNRLELLISDQRELSACSGEAMGDG